MNQLRVMLVVNSLCRGGAERQVVELAKGLDRQRFDPIVTTLYSGRALEQELIDSGIPLVSLERRRKDLATLPKFVRLLRRERIQIIQPYLTPATFYGLTASLIARTQVRIGTLRGAGDEQVRGITTRFYRFAETRLMRTADAVVPNSEAGRSDLVAQGIPPGIIRVIYNGVNSDRVRVREDEVAESQRLLRLPEGARVVGVIARLDKEKDHEMLLHAAARVRALRSDTYFVIVGEGVLRPKLEALAARLGLASHVRFVGEHSRVAPFLHRFDLAVLSSSSGEGCSNFLLESMAMGKPVVCTDVGGNRELITHGVSGFLVPPGATKQFANHILTILDEPVRARAMADAGRRRFQSQFTLESMVTQYEEMYQELWRKYVSRRTGHRETRALERERMR